MKDKESLKRKIRKIERDLLHNCYGNKEEYQKMKDEMEKLEKQLKEMEEKEND